MRGKKGRGAEDHRLRGIEAPGQGLHEDRGRFASRIALKQVIEAKIDPASTVYSDGWKAYDGLIDWGLSEALPG